MHGRHTVQYKAEPVCDDSMQLLPLRIKAAHFSVLAAAACAPSMANPSMVSDCCRCCYHSHLHHYVVQVLDRAAFAAAVRGLGE